MVEGRRGERGDLVGWVSFTQLAEWISSARGFLLTCGLFSPGQFAPVMARWGFLRTVR